MIILGSLHRDNVGLSYFVGIGIAAFVSTNIDDLFILMVFFAALRFPSFQIVLGQYIGMGSLMGVSLVGSLITLILPRNIIGLIISDCHRNQGAIGIT